MAQPETDGAFFVHRYSKDPARYVTEVLGVQKIEPWQAALLEDVKAACINPDLPRRFAVRSGHGIGKTCFMAWINKWFNSTRPDPQTVVTANTESQLSTKTWRELAKWNNLAKDGHWFEHTATKFFLKSAPKTWFASAIPWSERNSEAFAGTHEEHVLYIFDEASGIPDIIWEVSEGAMTTKGAFWFAFGNPTRNTGRFTECWGKYRHRWKTYEVDSRNVSIADQAQIQKWIDDEGEDSDFVRVRVKGQPPRTSMFEFISPEDVDKGILYQSQGHEAFPKIFGVDVARYGDDRNVIFQRQGRKSKIIKVWSGLDGMQSASHIIDAIQADSPQVTFVDDGGVGGPILDRVRAIVGESVIGINFGAAAANNVKWFNKRAEMWGEMRDALRAGLSIPDHKELRADLLGPLYMFSPKEQIKLERKEDMKKRGLASPDFADALALTYAQKVTLEAMPNLPKGFKSQYTQSMGFV